MLHATIERLGEATIWRCAGQLVRGDESTKLLQRVIAAKSRRVLLDLAGIDSVDASGLGTLICLLRWSRDNGVALQLIDPSPRLLELLELTKLDTLFDIFLPQKGPLHKEAFSAA